MSQCFQRCRPTESSVEQSVSLEDRRWGSRPALGQFEQPAFPSYGPRI